MIFLLGSSSPLVACWLWMMAASSKSSTSPTPSKRQANNNREFRLVPYGQPFVDSSGKEDNEHDRSRTRPTISCDGRIPGGVTLELTHWNNNETPDSLYADTSTEMALKFATATTDNIDKNVKDPFDDALILNNHYDTDGVLSVWACLEPEKALEYSSLLKEGAEAGDFEEWNSDNGIKLDCVIESILNNNENEEAAYRKVLAELPNVLQDLTNTGGQAYCDLWNNGFQQALQDYEEIQRGKVSLERGPGKMVLVQRHQQQERESSLSGQQERLHHLSPYALHRGLTGAGLLHDTTRILSVVCQERKTGATATATDNASSGTSSTGTTSRSVFDYRYQLPGHGWVRKLVDRPVIPPVDDTTALLKTLEISNASSLGQQQQQQLWRTISGSLVGVCETTRLIEAMPNEIASLLYQVDKGSH